MMPKSFNITGACRPAKHYMVDLTSRLEEIKKMIDDGQYFTINCGRQYGKTTMLRALAKYLQNHYEVISLDFQRMSSSSFESEHAFVTAFSGELLEHAVDIPEAPKKKLENFADETAKQMTLQSLFRTLNLWCKQSKKPVVLLIDEVDTATNNQIFLDFLAQLRAAYLDSDVTPTFQSVILAGVYDVRNIKRKLRPDEEHKVNSPWNIAAKFQVDMNFSAEEIAKMLKEYESTYHTGMDIKKISTLIYDYTSGYPYLVCSLCKNLDEEIPGTADFPDKSSAWTPQGFIEAEKLLLSDNNALFQSLTGKLTDYPKLRTVLYQLLFTGKPIPYVLQNQYIDIAAMFGFIKNNNGNAVISNRIFESILYNLFISEEAASNQMYDAGLQEKNQFIVSGYLNVRKILEKFVETFDFLYGDTDEKFLEEAGRRYFMLFLKPIINGIGNTYVESQTRNHERMDLVIDYRGQQSIIELKIWRGNAYNERGEEQLSGYLDYFHLKKGYMLSFNFNKKKEVGVKEILLGDRVLIEAVV